MIQHVAIEVRPADLARSVELWELLGFELVEPPPSLAADFTWLQREGTQIHLMHEESPTVPPRGHIAVIVPRSYLSPDSGKKCDINFGELVERLREAGFEVLPGREHWGSPRAKVGAPGGHSVELMESPPS